MIKNTTVVWASVLSLTLGAIWYIKRKCEKTVSCNCNWNVRDKVIVITGATSGIGYHTAVQLAKQGGRVYIACRNKEAATSLVNKLIKLTRNQEIFSIDLDLSNLCSCRKFVNIFSECEERLDILINNAGIFNHPPQLTVDGYEITIQTNFVGPLLLTELLIPYLLKSPSGRIIFVNSEAHKLSSLEEIQEINPSTRPICSSFNSCVRYYGTSKLALKIYAGHLASNFSDSNISVASVNPGNTWTKIFRHSWLSLWELPTRIACFLFMRSAYEGSQTVIHAVNVPSLTSGSYISDCKVVEGLLDSSILLKTEGFIAIAKKWAGVI